MMTPSEAKKDCAKRLTAVGITFSKLSAKTWSFEGFGFGKSVFVTVYDAQFPQGERSRLVEEIKAAIPKPSEGGYVIEYN